jgi:hypothetical protein
VLLQAARRLHRAIGADIQDPRTTFLTSPFKVTYEPQNEDVAGAPVHLILGAALLAGTLVLGVRGTLVWTYFPIPYAAFFLFCAALKWQPWHARLQLPVFCLLAPLLGCAGAIVRPLGAVAALAALVALAPGFRGNSRPLWGRGNVFVADRLELMFRVRPELYRATLDVARFVRTVRAKSVGFDTKRDDWEYPLQKLILGAPEPPRFSAFDGFCPKRPRLRPERCDLVVAYDSAALELSQPGVARYRIVRQFHAYSVYLREDLAAGFAQDPSAMAFIGWEKSEGLGRLEGPYPSLALPVVRWGWGPRTRLVFTSTGGPACLAMRGCGTEGSSPSMTVQLNGVEIGRWVLPPAYRLEDARLDFEAKSGTNEIALEYGSWDTRADYPLAVLFGRLAILARGCARP